MASVYACISHKGGTGRTVTTANVAYHLATLGKNVCILDLDLASPTLGAVVGLLDIGPGASEGKGIHDVLFRNLPPEAIREIERDVWESSDIRLTRTFRCGEFHLIPGTRSGGDAAMSDAVSRDRPRERLARVLDELTGRYDFVFCDLRSGIGAVADAFVSRPVVERLDAWLLFHRWTRQHLVGVIDLAENLSNTSELPKPFMRIRTAAVDRNTVPAESKAWIDRRHDELVAEANRLNAVTDPPIEDLGYVPSDLLLQWSECILTTELATTKGTVDTINAFGHIARRLVDLRSDV